MSALPELRVNFPLLYLPASLFKIKCFIPHSVEGQCLHVAGELFIRAFLWLLLLLLLPNMSQINTLEMVSMRKLIYFSDLAKLT